MFSPDAFVVRNFERGDAGRLLELMLALAEFEGYDREFAVTESELLRRGLGERPQFEALVAEDAGAAGELLGMAVYHFVPYTFDLHPDTILKELFVAPAARSLGVGQALMARLGERARSAGSKRIKWLVLPGNDKAKRFYSALGARHDASWETWSMQIGGD